MNDAAAIPLLIDAAWITFLTVWVIAARKTRATQRREPAFSRYGIMVLLVAGYVLILSPKARIGFLGQRFLPDILVVKLVVKVVGVIVTWLGVGLAIWARRHLAENWSARVTIKVDHELIRTGPYARLRHPIYTGLLLATLGPALALGEWRGLLGTGIALIAYSLKAKKEESMLRAQFGAAFEEHSRHTGFLLPRL
jgi:protein-S-isoprenylcysteine O-methyltransferase Ste14